MINFNNVSITPSVINTSDQFILSVEVTAQGFSWSQLINVKWQALKSFVWGKLKGG
jgi:hypothetical protein